ncbi:phage holin family protein [Paracoccus stylophorae]|uniref:Phage holin family protein n=1 Tax=Paracoccus stylophorae TaxID=659350 RepID=A0ABY7STG8_9RHOB|nr:phage holin family protein [Paracoccus stylophorae]WCR10319.1 phage holin family protein [Paracoccus stylophorae]
MREDHSTKSAGGLVQDAMSNVSALVRNEVDLARAEINENLTKAGVAAGMIAAGAIVVLVALNVLAAALVAALTEAGLDGGWAALIVGVVLAVIAYVMIQKGMNDLKLSSLAPTRTAKNVRRDAEAVKDVYDDK